MFKYLLQEFQKKRDSSFNLKNRMVSSSFRIENLDTFRFNKPHTKSPFVPGSSNASELRTFFQRSQDYRERKKNEQRVLDQVLLSENGDNSHFNTEPEDVKLRRQKSKELEEIQLSQI